MSKIAVFLAEGFEEIEALTVVDICRRSNLSVDMVSITNDCMVTGSHGISVKADTVYGDICCCLYDMLVLPGGLKGTQGLEADECVTGNIREFYLKEKYIAAICAAPSIFGHMGILKGKKACCYPSFESHLEGAKVTKAPVEISGNVVTSRGMGTAIPFALAIVAIFCGRDAAEKIAKQIVYENDYYKRNK